MLGSQRKMCHLPLRKDIMDFLQLLGAYGPVGAAVVGVAIQIAKVYVDKFRLERLAREQRIVEVVEKNTIAWVNRGRR